MDILSTAASDPPPPPQRSAAAAAAAGNSAAMLTARELRLIAETFAIGGCYILISASFLGTKKYVVDLGGGYG